MEVSRRACLAYGNLGFPTHFFFFLTRSQSWQATTRHTNEAEAWVQGRGQWVVSGLYLFWCHKPISVTNISKINKAIWQETRFLVSRATQETESPPQRHPWWTCWAWWQHPIQGTPIKKVLAVASLCREALCETGCVVTICLTWVPNERRPKQKTKTCRWSWPVSHSGSLPWSLYASYEAWFMADPKDLLTHW